MSCTKQIVIAVLILLSADLAAASELQADGFLSIADAGQKSYLAVRVEISTAAATSVRWFNNDETSQASVRVVPINSDGGPATSHPGVETENVQWASDGWVTADLFASVGSSAGAVFVLFEYPAFNAIESRGFGGGCGIGYRSVKSGPLSMISHDGSEWTSIHPSIAALVELGTVEETPEVIFSVVGKQVSNGESARGEAVQSENIRPVTLEPARPNPFNPSTDIVFRLGVPAKLNLSIYDVRGRLVGVLRSGAYPVGEYRVRWDGRSRSGDLVASGVYFAQLVANGERHSQRLVLLK